MWVLGSNCEKEVCHWERRLLANFIRRRIATLRFTGFQHTNHLHPGTAERLRKISMKTVMGLFRGFEFALLRLGMSEVLKPDGTAQSRIIDIMQALHDYRATRNCWHLGRDGYVKVFTL